MDPSDGWLNLPQGAVVKDLDDPGLGELAGTSANLVHQQKPLETRLFEVEPTPDDINQRFVSSCAFHASLLSIFSAGESSSGALSGAEVFLNMMAFDRERGRVVVRLYDPQSGQPQLVSVLPTRLTSKKTNESWVSRGPWWVSMLEKAFASFNYGRPGPSYDALSSVQEFMAWRVLLGADASSMQDLSAWVWPALTAIQSRGSNGVPTVDNERELTVQRATLPPNLARQQDAFTFFRLICYTGAEMPTAPGDLLQKLGVTAADVKPYSARSRDAWVVSMAQKQRVALGTVAAVFPSSLTDSTGAAVLKAIAPKGKIVHPCKELAFLNYTGEQVVRLTPGQCAPEVLSVRQRLGTAALDEWKQRYLDDRRHYGWFSKLDDAAFRVARNELDASLKAAGIADAARAKLLAPVVPVLSESRGRGGYALALTDLFQRIAAGQSQLRPIVLGSHLKALSEPGNPEGGKEKKDYVGKGLAGQHGYPVFNTIVNDQVQYVLVRNPWGKGMAKGTGKTRPAEYGRQYTWKTKTDPWTGATYPVLSASKVADPVFRLELTDIGKRFVNVRVGPPLDQTPAWKAAEQNATQGRQG